MLAGEVPVAGPRASEVAEGVEIKTPEVVRLRCFHLAYISVSQAASAIGCLRFLRRSIRPRPRKPVISIAQVAGSGIAEASGTSSRPEEKDAAPVLPFSGS